MTNFKQAMKSLGDFRLYLLIVPAMIYLGSDLPVLKSLLYSVSAMLLIVGVAHWTRKITHPYLDIAELLAVSKREPISAAVSLLAFSIIFSAVVLGAVWWVRG